MKTPQEIFELLTGADAIRVKDLSGSGVRLETIVQIHHVDNRIDLIQSNGKCIGRVRIVDLVISPTGEYKGKIVVAGGEGFLLYRLEPLFTMAKAQQIAMKNFDKMSGL